MRTRPGRFALASFMLAASVGLVACGGDEGGSAGSSGAATTATTAAPEDRIAPDAEVGAGLAKLKRVAAKVAAAADGAQAKDAAGESLERVWQPIEGTVKRNEPDLYLDVEDSFQRLQSGDLANAKKGAQALSTAIDAYLAKHPSS